MIGDKEIIRETIKAELSRLLINLLHELNEGNIVNVKECNNSVTPPKNLMGWTTFQCERGYWRCYKRIGLVMYSIYIGKIWNNEKAKTKIKEKMDKIGELFLDDEIF